MSERIGSAGNARAQLYDALDSLDAVVYHMDAARPLVPVFVSRGIEVLGFSRDELLARPELWTRRLHPEDRDRVLAEEVRARAADESLCHEYRMVARDGSVLVFEDRAAWLRDASGRHVAWQGVMTNVTPRAAAQAALRSSEERFRALVENNDEPIAVVDAAGTITYASPAWERQLGLAPAHLLGRTIFDLAHPDDRAAVAARFAELVTAPGAIGGVEYRVGHADGSWRTVSTKARNLLDDAPVHGVVLNTRDITERRVLEERLRQSQRLEAVGRLTGGIAHDFNNILTVIKLHTQFVLDELTPGGQHHEDLREVARAADRAASLTQQLLAFSRQQVLKPVPLELNALLSGVRPLLQRLAGPEVQLAIEQSDDSPWVLADPAQLEQVLVNLVGNAAEAMPDGGTVSVSTGLRELSPSEASRVGSLPPGLYGVVTVHDTGHGMDDATLARAFEPFFTTKARGKGMGLGLATVHGIVEQSGGAVLAESAQGRGSTFVVYLPTAAGSVLTTTGTVRAAGRPPAGTVLVVEDEESIRRVVSRTLRQRGYLVLQAGSGREAMELCDRHAGTISLVLSDVVMPEMGGRALREWLADAHPRIPVLLMTGYTDDEVIRGDVTGDASGDAGRADVAVLQKPFTGAELLRAVEQALQGI